MTVEIVSIYMPNVSDEVAEFQARVVEKFNPENYTTFQYKVGCSHAEAMNSWAKACSSDILIFLDIDCIPLKPESLSTLVKEASEYKLAGCAQRANHIMNGEHIYVSPFCMAFRPQAWRELGCPSFAETHRGDVGEELTYKWKGEIHMLWPTACEAPMWSLDSSHVFGPGTTYADMFYHAFYVRENADRFVKKCIEVLG